MALNLEEERVSEIDRLKLALAVAEHRGAVAEVQRRAAELDVLSLRLAIAYKLGDGDTIDASSGAIRRAARSDA